MEREFNMTVMGSILVVTGILAFLCGNVDADRQKTLLVEQRSFHPTAAARYNDPFPPVVAGLSLVGGMVLLALPLRNRARSRAGAGSHGGNTVHSWVRRA